MGFWLLTAFSFIVMRKSCVMTFIATFFENRKMSVHSWWSCVYQNKSKKAGVFCLRIPSFSNCVIYKHLNAIKLSSCSLPAVFSFFFFRPKRDAETARFVSSADNNNDQFLLDYFSFCTLLKEKFTPKWQSFFKRLIESSWGEQFLTKISIILK